MFQLNWAYAQQNPYEKLKCCEELKKLLQKYANAQSREDVYIKRTLENIAAQFDMCDDDQRYYADVVTRDFCRIIEMMLKWQAQQAAQTAGNGLSGRNTRYETADDLARAFYNYYRRGDQVDYWDIGSALRLGRKQLVNPTMKDYVARIYTFAGDKYLGEMFTREEMANKDPVLFTYENIELILATFKTRDEMGEIIKQRVNIRSALRKLNEFKHNTEQQ